jgi:hypothetical protein
MRPSSYIAAVRRDLGLGSAKKKQENVVERAISSRRRIPLR